MGERIKKLRSERGLSQEQLAELLGVSRQAVSKWERVEASPDTDNLIALAELYGVSLDELVLGKSAVSKPDAETITIKKGNKTVLIQDTEKGHFIHVNDDAEDDEDEDEEHGFHATAEIQLSAGKPGKSPVHRFFQAFPFPVLTLIAYLVFGFMNICGGWVYGWLVFLLIPIYYSLVDSIFSKKADEFAFPVAITLVYLWLGFDQGLWHPMWILFLTVPFYYWFCEFIAKLRKKTKEE